MPAMLPLLPLFSFVHIPIRIIHFRQGSLFSEWASPPGSLRLGLPGRKKWQTAALKLAFDDLAHDLCAAGDAHLDHGQPQEGLDRIGTDLHTIRDLLAREPVNQQYQRFPLAFRQMKLLGKMIQPKGRSVTALDQDRERRLKSALSRRIH